METRTEEDKLLQAPVRVTLGGTEYEIKPLPIVKANKWRRDFISLMQEMTDLASVTTDDKADNGKSKFDDALTKILLDEPEKLVDLFFAYVPDLPKDTIENSASSAEILHAIEEVVRLESPFFGAAIRVTNVARKHLAP